MGFSADGDSRLLSSMRSKVNLDFSELSEESLQKYFDNVDSAVYIQDTIHIATKLRNRLLKPSIMLPMGDYQVSIAHIKMLLSLVEKDVHGLVLSDICPEDRQNFQSFEKITELRVLKSLEKTIFGSEATIAYLKICVNIVSSFLNMDLKPSERIYRIWHSVYFLRAWRKWLQNMKYKVSDHFISANSYACIEINAHGLISAIQLFRNNMQPDMFLPYLMASQPCEHIFRQMRSMTTANYTKINFSLFELLHLISRVELMNEIIYTRMNIDGVNFPRAYKVYDNSTSISTETSIELNIETNHEMGLASNIAQPRAQQLLPTNREIIQVLLNARSDALKYAADIGMQVQIAEIEKCDLSKGKEVTDEEEDIWELRPEELDENIIENVARDVDVDLRTSMRSKYIDLRLEDGSVKSVKKSTFIWMLTDSKGKMSSDRLKRVQDATKENEKSAAKRKKIDETATNSARMNVVNENGPNQRLDSNNKIFMKTNEIEIGDYCFFKQKKTELSEQNVLKNCVVGCIIAFKYVKQDGRETNLDEIAHTSANTSQVISNQARNKQKVRPKLYSLDFAPTDQVENRNIQTSIQALATWHSCEENGKLEPLKKNSNFLGNFFHDMNDYIAKKPI